MIVRASLRKHPFLPGSSPAGEVSARNVPSGEERGETDVSAGYVRGDVGLGRISVLLDAEL